MLSKKNDFFMIVFISYCIALFYLVLFTPARLSHHVIAPARLIPLKGTIEDIISHPKYNIGSHYLTLILNFFGNILLFIPLGILLSFFCKDHPSTKKIVLLSAFLLSVCIEVSQFIFRLGVFDVDDILLNFLGAWLGIHLYLRIKAAEKNKSQ